MFRIGSVRVAEKATIELYKNINATLPTGKTEGNLAHAFYQVRNSKKDQAGRFDALYLLGDVYEKLTLKEVLSGAHSFVKPTIETIATNKDDRLWPEAAEILGLEPQNGYFERKDAYLQQGSDFSNQLLETTPAKNEHELMVLYAIAKHGAKVAEGAGNQLALLSIGAFSEASSQELKPLAGLLLKNLVEIEIARPRKAMWESMGALSLNRIFADLKRREQHAKFFMNNFGIKPEDIDSAEKLAEVLRRSRMKMRKALPIYFNSLPTVIDNKVLKISLDFWHNFVGNDWFELNTLAHPFNPLNRQLAFIMPTE